MYRADLARSLAGRFNIWKAIWLEAEYQHDRTVLLYTDDRRVWLDTINRMTPEEFTRLWDDLNK